MGSSRILSRMSYQLMSLLSFYVSTRVVILERLIRESHTISQVWKAQLAVSHRSTVKMVEKVLDLLDHKTFISKPRHLLSAMLLFELSRQP